MEEKEFIKLCRLDIFFTPGTLAEAIRAGESIVTVPPAAAPSAAAASDDDVAAAAAASDDDIEVIADVDKANVWSC